MADAEVMAAAVAYRDMLHLRPDSWPSKRKEAKVRPARKSAVESEGTFQQERGRLETCLHVGRPIRKALGLIPSIAVMF